MIGAASRTTVLIVPGLREHVADHWQTLYAARTPGARTVPPGGRENLDLFRRIQAIEREAQAIAGPLILVAHSGGVIAVAHWARLSRRQVAGALLAVPPDFERPLPAGYPELAALSHGGWLPIPRARLPFPSIVAASSNDPLGAFDRVAELATCWGSRLVNLGEVGHLNPASGFGPWPEAGRLVAQLVLERVDAPANTDNEPAKEAV